MLQHLHRNFDLYWDPSRYLSIGAQSIGFQVRHKDKLQIAFKYSGGGFQTDAVFDHGYIYSFIYLNDDISDSKHYICATSEKAIWILKSLKTEWNHVYMDHLYNNGKLCRAEYAEKKRLHGVDSTHGIGVTEEIIHQEVKSN